MSEDWRSDRIVQVILENPDGLRYEPLRKKSGPPDEYDNGKPIPMNKKPFATKLAKLRKQKLVKKIYKKSESGKKYGVYVIGVQNQFIEDFAMNFKNFRVFDSEKWDDITKTQKIESLPFVLEFFANHYSEALLYYVVEPNGKILYKAALRIIEEKLDGIRKRVRKDFTGKEMDRFSEYASDSNVHNHNKILDMVFSTLNFQKYSKRHQRLVMHDMLQRSAPFGSAWFEEVWIGKKPNSRIIDFSILKQKIPTKELEFRAEYYRTKFKLELMQQAIIEGKTSTDELDILEKDARFEQYLHDSLIKDWLFKPEKISAVDGLLQIVSATEKRIQKEMVFHYGSSKTLDPAVEDESIHTSASRFWERLQTKRGKTVVDRLP